MDAMWQEYGMEELEKGMQKLFPASRISVAELMGQLLQGDVLGAAGTLLQEVIQGMGASAAGRKNILIWLIVLGILSALLIHFVEVFDKHQIADLSFYFIYLLMGVILLQCFSGILGTARETVENIVLFVRLMVPTYLLAVGVASGPATVGAGYQLMLLLIYGTEKILLGVVLPLIYCYGLLTMINGIWVEEKLTLLTELLEKAVGWILKASLGVVTGISVFQSLSGQFDTFYLHRFIRIALFFRKTQKLFNVFFFQRKHPQLSAKAFLRQFQKTSILRLRIFTVYFGADLSQPVFPLSAGLSAAFRKC